MTEKGKGGSFGPFYNFRFLGRKLRERQNLLHSVVCTAEEEAIHVLHHTILELSTSIIYYSLKEAIRHQKMGQTLWKNC
jgi:hypothetical protein